MARRTHHIAGRAPLRTEEVKPRKRLGQNFLRDRSVLPKILGAADLTGDDDVLEIGAGTGVLTAALANEVRRVVAVELDDRLADLLASEFAENTRVEVWHGNALDLDPSSLFPTAYKIVANIPYYITGILVRHYLESASQPSLMVLMVQREVAERMAASPGNLSLLGVSVQYYADVCVVARVPAGAFHPRPRVDSAIVRLAPHHGSTGPDTDAFFTVARAGFGQRRKQLVNSLAAGLGIPRVAAASLLVRADIRPSMRAEELAVSDWKRLAANWQEDGAK